VRTSEEKRAIVKRVEELRLSGVPVKDACKQLGIASSAFYAYRDSKPKVKTKATKLKARPFMQEIAPDLPTGTHKVACIIGSPQDISAVLKGMS
jgi:hypothetical protein